MGVRGINRLGLRKLGVFANRGVLEGMLLGLRRRKHADAVGFIGFRKPALKKWQGCEHGKLGGSRKSDGCRMCLGLRELQNSDFCCVCKLLMAELLVGPDSQRCD